MSIWDPSEEDMVCRNSVDQNLNVGSHLSIAITVDKGT